MVSISLILPKSLTANQQDCIEQYTPPGADCGNWVYTPKLINVSHMGLGNCSVELKMLLRECLVIEGNCTTVVTQYRLLGLDWAWSDDPGHDCYSFTQHLMPGYPDNFSGINQYNFSVFIKEAVEHIMYTDFLSVPNKEDFPCDGTYPNCQMPECIDYSAFYFGAKCNDICFRLIDGIIEATIMPCEINSGCCMISGKFCACMDDSTPPKIMNNDKQFSYITDIINCPAVPGPQETNCPYGTGHDTHYQPCTTLCVEE